MQGKGSKWQKVSMKRKPPTHRKDLNYQKKSTTTHYSRFSGSDPVLAGFHQYLMKVRNLRVKLQFAVKKPPGSVVSSVSSGPSGIAKFLYFPLRSGREKEVC